ncbi:Uncharacterised protein [Klebsiella variicola]|nr:Uncharacterised protein [Klebsiella variicola]
MGARVQPGKTAPQQFNMQITLLQIHLVQGGDLQLAALRRLHVLRHLHHVIVVEVEPGHRPVRFRLQRFLLDGQCLKVLIELHHPEALRIQDLVAKHRGTGGLRRCRFQLFTEALAKVDIIPQHQGAGIVADELLANDKSLRQAVRRRLDSVAEVHPELRPVTQQALEGRHVVRRGDDQDVANARQHQDGHRVENHRLVVDWQQLLGDALGDRI